MFKSFLFLSLLVFLANCSYNGIDVSVWQGDNIDFKKVKADGKNFVIIRAGCGSNVDKYFESVTRFYQNAMRYCDRYSDNKTQVEGFSTLYMKLVTTNLKQISCNGNMSFGAKYLKIKMICASEDVQSALLHANMSRKRKITHFLIRNNMIVLIISMYRVLGGVKKFR